jgi:hypothetical protein
MHRDAFAAVLTAGSLLWLAAAAPTAARAQASPPAAAAAAAPAPTLNPPSPPAPADPQADAIAAGVLDAMGGKAAWDGSRYLHWTFAGRRTHTWDKWTGRHRVEGTTRDGERFVVLDNLNTHEGSAWINGKPAEGERAKKLVDAAYQMWVNDAYWLLMPYKLRDPGVNLGYAGKEDVDGKPYDKLTLSFGQVGLTPGDHYWIWVNRDTHLVDRWAYLLQDQPRDTAPTVWLWQGWKRYGKVMLAPTRVQPDHPERKLELSDLAVLDLVPETAFTSPEPLTGALAAPPPPPPAPAAKSGR